MLTLFTTPVVYLYLDRLQTWLGGARHGARGAEGEPELLTPVSEAAE